MFIPQLLRNIAHLTSIVLLAGAIFLIAGSIVPMQRASASSTQKQGCVSANANYQELVHQFDYTTQKSLQKKEISVTVKNGVSIHDITYISQNKVVSAYLVVPAGNGPFAGILFMHWLDSSLTANRTEFLNEAITLAHKGVVSLLPQGFYPWIEAPQNVKHDCTFTIQQVIAMRRGIDLLLTYKQVDHHRIAFVGHDYGAMYGAVLAGVEKRVKTFILMAPTARFSNWNVPFFLDTLTPKQRLDYTIDTASLDPITFIGYTAPAPVLFQFARQDKYVSLADLNNLVEVAGTPNTIKLYNADHSLTDDLSQRDRIAWISTQLGLH